MKLQVKRFDELSLEELYQILRLRVDVFVVEQSCPYHEIDGIPHVKMLRERGSHSN